MSRPFVRVLGVALAVGACKPTPPPGNPPAPPPTDPSLPTANPPAPLPTWDEVTSSHPEGATNPPSPVLVVLREPKACFKAWMGGMMPLPADIARAGGQVVATPADVGLAKEIQCPPGQPETLLAAWDQPAAGPEGADAPTPGGGAPKEAR